MPYGHRVGTNKIRTDPPIAAVDINFFFSSVVCVVLVRQFVHLTNHFFSATHFFELIRDEVLVISFFLPVSVTVRSTFPYVVAGNRKEVKN